MLSNSLNSNTTTDLGTGGGMPGIIIAIMIKNLKNAFIEIKLSSSLQVSRETFKHDILE